MKKDLLFRLAICIACFGVALYSYLRLQNDLTGLKLKIPHLSKELKLTLEENTRLKYQIDAFESPSNLIKLCRMDQYSHLKYPLLSDIVVLQEGIALKHNKNENKLKKTQTTFVIGAQR